jgi:predicted SAM-dependent methyltransferase
MLHIAPEPYMRIIFEENSSVEYKSGDLQNEWRSSEKIDITDIQYPDNAFDVIYCSHVLEHVPEDRKAMNELYRVLTPGGWAVLQVPISGEETYEDPSVTDPEERRRLFGSRDHVRQYGRDYKDRLRAAGFVVREYLASDVVGEENLETMGVIEDESVFYCTKN